ncbi:site-specific DNA-methyltransferase [bacterium]|nr:site-specific DNA-methyltransferase [bacterium]
MEERVVYEKRLLNLDAACTLSDLQDCTINQDVFEVLELLPDESFELLFADPPYNLTKTFNRKKFSRQSVEDYELWLDSWISKLPRLMKADASVYICGDWRSSGAIQKILSRYFSVRNRITWEREKGRGAKNNWKNSSEDIWFATVSNNYTFNLDAVKTRRQVIAPYKDSNGKPKDWVDGEQGKIRITHPSNLWTDLTVPFWSMPENTDHPTQKPEKLLAKIIMASSNSGDFVLDPFLGSGTTSVVAKKLGRHYVGIEEDEEYCCIAEKRLALADKDSSIQGFVDGIFWERNSFARQSKKKR